MVCRGNNQGQSCWQKDAVNTTIICWWQVRQNYVPFCPLPQPGILIFFSHLTYIFSKYCFLLQSICTNVLACKSTRKKRIERKKNLIISTSTWTKRSTHQKKILNMSWRRKEKKISYKFSVILFESTWQGYKVNNARSNLTIYFFSLSRGFFVSPPFFLNDSRALTL